MTLLPVFVFWAVALAGLRGSPVVLLYALFAGIPFAALAVVPVELTGGLTLTPAAVVTLLLVLKCLWRPAGRRWFAYASTSLNHFALLFAFWVVAVLTTVFAPRLFAGEVEVISMRGIMNETTLLVPSVQQFSQLGYISVSVFAVIAAGRYLQGQRVRQHVLRAMALGAAVLCVTGLLDWLSKEHPEIEPWLEPVRTASYAITGGGVLADMPRVSGVTPEPSTFGSLCVTFLATLWFYRRVMLDGWLRNLVAPLLCAGLAAMIWLSTSTTAYVALGFLVLVAVAETLWRLVLSRRRTRARRIAWSQGRRLVALTALVAAFFALSPELYDRAQEVVDTVVLKKTESGSYDERSMWTAVSLQSAIDTLGFGVGLGGTRASNSFVAMLSNVGLVGTLLYLGFIAATYLRRPARDVPNAGAWQAAYRWSVPVVLAPGLMAGTSADFGPYVALMFGSTVALQQGRRTERMLERVAREERRRDPRARRDRRRAEGFVLDRRRRGSSRGRAPFAVLAAAWFDLGEPTASASPASGVRPHGGGVDIELGDDAEGDARAALPGRGGRVGASGRVARAPPRTSPADGPADMIVLG